MKKLLLLVALIPLYATADFFEALDAYEKKNYESAYNQFLEMAKLGETRSQFNLGVMFYNGEFVEKDINQSYAWLKLASESKTASEKELNTFEQIKGKVSDHNSANQVYNNISQYSNDQLLVNLYPEFLDTEETNPDQATAIKIEPPKYPKRAAMSGVQGWVKFTLDIDSLGYPRDVMLLESVPEKVFEKSSLKAIKKWKFKPSIDESEKPHAVKNVVYTMEFRLNNTDPMKIKESVIKKAESGLTKRDAHSQFQIATWSKYGLLKNDKYDSKALFLESAIQGHAVSQYEVGRSLVFGKGCKQDKTKGLTWLNRAASNGQPDAKELLANVLMTKEDLDSQKLAVKYYLEIDKKSARTSINLARLLTGSEYQEVLDPQKAIDIVEGIQNRKFRDDITIDEIKAAAYFKMGKIKKAISYQEDALEEAEDVGADASKTKETLKRYIAHRKSS